MGMAVSSIWTPFFLIDSCLLAAHFGQIYAVFAEHGTYTKQTKNIIKYEARLWFYLIRACWLLILVKYMLYMQSMELTKRIIAAECSLTTGPLSILKPPSKYSNRRAYVGRVVAAQVSRFVYACGKFVYACSRFVYACNKFVYANIAIDVLMLGGL